MYKLTNNQLIDLDNPEVFNEVVKRCKRHLKRVTVDNIDQVLSMSLLNNDYRDDILDKVNFNHRIFKFNNTEKATSLKYGTKLLAVKYDTHLDIIEAITGIIVKKIDIEQCAYSFNPDGKLFVLIADNKFILYDSDDFGIINMVPFNHVLPKDIFWYDKLEFLCVSSNF